MIRSALRWGFARTWDWTPVLAARLVPRYRRMHGRWPNLARPQRFSEKTLARMLFDRRPLLATCAGKAETRDLVRDRIGERYLVPLHAVLRDADHLPDFPPA